MPYYVAIIWIEAVALLLIATGVYGANSGTIGVIMLLQITFHATVAFQLFRHQKSLEWFRNHVRLDVNRLPEDAPEDMGREEDDER